MVLNAWHDGHRPSQRSSLCPQSVQTCLGATGFAIMAPFVDCRFYGTTAATIDAAGKGVNPGRSCENR
jgi:hypothetical protein